MNDGSGKLANGRPVELTSASEPLFIEELRSEEPSGAGPHSAKKATGRGAGLLAGKVAVWWVGLLMLVAGIWITRQWLSESRELDANRERQWRLAQQVASERASTFAVSLSEGLATAISSVGEIAANPQVIAAVAARNARYGGTEAGIRLVIEGVDQAWRAALEQQAEPPRPVATNAVADQLREILQRVPVVGSLLVVDGRGAAVVATSVPARYDFSTQPWFLAGIAGTTSIAPGPVSGSLEFFRPVEIGGVSAGVVWLSIDENRLAQAVLSRIVLPSPPQTVVEVRDVSGRVIAAVGEQEIDASVEQASARGDRAAEYLQASARLSPAAPGMDPLGLHNLDWSLWVKQPAVVSVGGSAAGLPRLSSFLLVAAAPCLLLAALLGLFRRGTPRASAGAESGELETSGSQTLPSQAAEAGQRRSLGLRKQLAETEAVKTKVADSFATLNFATAAALEHWAVKDEERAREDSTRRRQLLRSAESLSRAADRFGQSLGVMRDVVARGDRAIELLDRMDSVFAVAQAGVEAVEKLGLATQASARDSAKQAEQLARVAADAQVLALNAVLAGARLEAGEGAGRSLEEFGLRVERAMKEIAFASDRLRETFSSLAQDSVGTVETARSASGDLHGAPARSREARSALLQVRELLQEAAGLNQAVVAVVRDEGRALAGKVGQSPVPALAEFAEGGCGRRALEALAEFEILLQRHGFNATDSIRASLTTASLMFDVPSGSLDIKAQLAGSLSSPVIGGVSDE